MAIELPTMSLVANTRWAPVKSSSIKPKKKLTYITPDWSPIDSIVVPNNWVNTQEKALKSNPRQVEVNSEVPSWIDVF